MFFLFFTHCRRDERRKVGGRSDKRVLLVCNADTQQATAAQVKVVHLLERQPSVLCAAVLNVRCTSFFILEGNATRDAHRTKALGASIQFALNVDLSQRTKRLKDLRGNAEIF